MRLTPGILSVAILFAVACSSHTDQASPPSYAGQDQREIKALSAYEISAYRGGHGLGLAKAAELNHYPGPKHVIELAGALDLSAAQREATQRAYEHMHAQAVRLGEAIVAREKYLDSLFATQTLEAAVVSAAVADIARLQGELRAAHLLAHVEMKKILSALQIAKYDELRGYGKAGQGRQTSPSPQASH